MCKYGSDNDSSIDMCMMNQYEYVPYSIITGMHKRIKSTHVNVNKIHVYNIDH